MCGEAMSEPLKLGSRRRCQQRNGRRRGPEQPSRCSKRVVHTMRGIMDTSSPHVERWKKPQGCG